MSSGSSVVKPTMKMEHKNAECLDDSGKVTDLHDKDTSRKLQLNCYRWIYCYCFISVAFYWIRQRIYLFAPNCLFVYLFCTRFVHSSDLHALLLAVQMNPWSPQVNDWYIVHKRNKSKSHWSYADAELPWRSIVFGTFDRSQLLNILRILIQIASVGQTKHSVFISSTKRANKLKEEMADFYTTSQNKGLSCASTTSTQVLSGSTKQKTAGAQKSVSGMFYSF